MCIGCRQKRPASELVRLVRSPDGGLAFGRSLPGRGAWLCRLDGEQGGPDERCIEAAQRRAAFPRAFRAPVRADAIEVLRASTPKRARMEGRGD